MRRRPAALACLLAASATAAGCTATTSGAAAPSDSNGPGPTFFGPVERQAPYGFSFNQDDQAQLAAFAAWRTWDACAVVPRQALETLTAVQTIEADDGSDLNSCNVVYAGGALPPENGKVVIGPSWGLTVEVGVSVPTGTGQVTTAQLGGRTVLLRPSAVVGSACDAYVDLGQGGRAIHLSLSWTSGQAPVDACTAARPLAEAAARSAASPPIRATAQVSRTAPAGEWALQDPCAGVNALGHHHSVQVNVPKLETFQCYAYVDGAGLPAQVIVGYGPSPGDPRQLARGGFAGETVVGADVGGRPAVQTTSNTGCNLDVQAGPRTPDPYVPQLSPDTSAVLHVAAKTCDIADELALDTRHLRTVGGGRRGPFWT